MKIVILGSAWPFRGGLAAYNERLARAFMEEGHSVVIYTFTLQYPDFLFPGSTQFSSDPAPSDLYILRRLNSINPFSWRKTAKEIADLNPDLLLIKFWLLEVRSTMLDALRRHFAAAQYLRLIHRRYFGRREFEPLIDSFVQDLVRAGAAEFAGGHLHNRDGR